jgi:hypothetical protein
MQPLDVGVFQPYKHWHNKAIQYAIANLDFEYTIASFLRDLADVWAQTFTKGTIKDAFRKAGMWPPNIQAVKTAMQKYVREAPIAKEPDLPTIPCTPQTLRQVEAKALQLQSKVYAGLSSPSRTAYKSLERGTNNLLFEGEIHRVESKMLYKRVEEFTKKAPTSRRRIQKGGELSGVEAQALIAEKDHKEAEAQIIAENKALHLAIKKGQKQAHAAGVVSRRTERWRRNILLELDPSDIGYSHLTVPIPDLETEAKQAAINALPGLQLPTEAFEDSIDYAELQDQWILGVSKTSDDFIPFEEQSESGSERSVCFDYCR